MEILSPKLNSFGSLSKTTKAVSSKGAYPFEQNSNYNKENVIDSIRKEKNSVRAEDNSSYQTRARSLERRNQNQLQGSYSYNRTEHTGNSSSLAAQFGNFFNSPKNVDGDFFKNQIQEKDSYRAKHLSRGLKTSFSKQDEKSSQSISNDQYLQSKIDQIINSSLSMKERSSKNTSSAAKPHSSTTNFEERSSEKLTLYTRLLNDMRTATPKSKELVNQDQQFGSSSSKHSTMNASSEYYSRNAEAKKPYLDLKLSSVDFDTNVKGDPKTTKSHQRLSFSQKRVERSEENVKPERADQQQDPRKSDYQKQERLSLSRTLTVNTQNVASEPQFIKHPVTTKNPKGGLRQHNDNQGIYESLSNLKKSLERPLNSSIHKSSHNVPSYNNFFGNEPKEAKEHREQKESKELRESSNAKDSKAIFKSSTPKANTVTSSEVKNILQSFRNVLQKESTPHNNSKNQLTGGDEKQNSSMNKRTLDDEAYQNYLNQGAQRNEEKQTSSYHQRPPSSSKSSKYRESSLNLNRRPEEKLSTSHSSQNTEKPQQQQQQPQRSLKDFITQVNSTDSLPIKAKLDLNVPGNERQSFSNLQGHPHSTKNSVPRPNNTNDKFLTISNTNTVVNMGKASSTTTNSSVAQESKSFSFNSSLINKHSSRVEEKNVPAANIKKEAQKAAAAICPYYMAGIDKYLRNNVNFETDYFAKIYKEHFLQGYQAINFCKYLKAVDPAELAKKKVYLPKKESHKDKKTIIFDLDETLIHCNENANIPSDVVLPIRFPHGDVIEAGINVRPYAIEALEELSKHFEIIVFTASHSCYANVVLDHLDPHNKYIHHRLFRESCVTTEEGLYIKDLRIFANRNLKDMVIVDNAMYSFGYQFENGIPIIPYYYHKSDKELKTLVPYLKSLYHVRDVRDINIKSFKLHSFAQHDSHEELLRRLFE